MALAILTAGCERKVGTPPALARGQKIGVSEPRGTGAQGSVQAPLGTNQEPASRLLRSDAPDWGLLSGFKYELYEVYSETNSGRALLKSDDVIPPEVKAHDGAKVSIAGYVLPLRIRSQRVTEFLLLRDQGTCCFGPQAQINHFIRVRFPAGFRHEGGSPWNVRGTLHVGETYVQGYLTGIYHLDADSVTEEGPATK